MQLIAAKEWRDGVWVPIPPDPVTSWRIFHLRIYLGYAWPLYTGRHFYYACVYVCLSRAHSNSYLLSLSLADQSERGLTLTASNTV